MVSVQKRSDAEKTLRKMWQFKSIYIMVLPIFIYFGFFTFYPMCLGIFQSFHQQVLFKEPIFIGLENYKTVLKDSVFRQAMFNWVYVGTLSLLINLFV